jgi:segregation and condensation protein B
MQHVESSPGYALRSIAQRYRQPTFERPWPPVLDRSWVTRCPWSFRRNDIATAEAATARSVPMARLEAVLFLAREPVGSRKLAQLASLADGTEARTLVRKLNRLYDEDGSALRAYEVAGGFQLMTRPKFAPWLRRLSSCLVEVRLSAPAMETLAVVAYRQPVLRADVEAIRGVQCGEILRQLLERDLVRIVGRSEELGRPYLYGTTRRFLEVFGLRHVDEIPRAELRGAGSEAPAENLEPAPETAKSDSETESQPTPTLPHGRGVERED